MTISPRSSSRRGRRAVGFAATCLALVLASYAVAGATSPVDVEGPAARTLVPVTEPGVPAPATVSGTTALLDTLDGELARWARSLEANPADFIAAGRLGELTLQRARITGDVADYRRALEAADRAIEADPIFWAARTLRASILFALHDFETALAEARATHEAAPDAPGALAVIGDASLELGDLEAANSAYRTLADLAPSPPVWSRQAHLAFLRGNPDAAVALVERCLEVTDDAAGTAFYAFQLADLHRATGLLEPAADAYGRSLEALDGYVPALAGLAHVREAQGDRPGAIALLERATAAAPQPDLLAALGDLYALAGDERAAERQYALVGRIGELATLDGSPYDRQLVLFAADHGIGVEAAVGAARTSLETRRDVYGYDALAWALHAAGRTSEAAEMAAEALAIGTPDPRIAYHAGIIALADGHPAEARQLLEAAVTGRAALPPLQAARAVEALTSLAMAEAGDR